MGLRVHKILGYGLYDIERDSNNEIIDPRINKDGYLFTNCVEDDKEKWSFKGFKKFWDNNIINKVEQNLLSEIMLTNKKRINLNICVNCDNEFALPEVLHIAPVSLVHETNDPWYRWDQIIDFQEETSNYNQTNRYEIYPFGIFPWTGSFCDSEGQRWVDQNDKPFASIAREFVKTKINRELDMFQVEAAQTYWAKMLGFDSIEEADKNIIPIIPEEIEMMCKYLELFNNNKTIYQLRPMLYVFWK